VSQEEFPEHKIVKKKPKAGPKAFFKYFLFCGAVALLCYSLHWSYQFLLPHQQSREVLFNQYIQSAGAQRKTVTSQWLHQLEERLVAKKETTDLVPLREQVEFMWGHFDSLAAGTQTAVLSLLSFVDDQAFESKDRNRLKKVYREASDVKVRVQSLLALLRLQKARVTEVDFILPSLNNGVDPFERQSLAYFLGFLDPAVPEIAKKKILNFLHAQLNADSLDLAMNAAFALMRLGDPLGSQKLEWYLSQVAEKPEWQNNQLTLGLMHNLARYAEKNSLAPSLKSYLQENLAAYKSLKLKALIHKILTQR